MRIWAISDGNPGHYNQTKAIIKALERVDSSIQVELLNVKLRLGGFRLLLRFLLNHFCTYLPFSLIGLFYELPELPLEKPNCIVSTGGKTLYLNAWLAQKYSCKNFFSGSLRGLKSELVTAFFTLVPFPGHANNIVLEHAPTLIEQEIIDTVGQKFIAEQQLQGVRLWALFIGGERFGYRYNDGDWDDLVAGLVSTAESQGVRWLLSTSRRTGAIVEQKLKQQLPAEVLADAVWWNEKPQPCMQEYLGAAEVVFVTEDSMAMIADGIASGRPVCTLAPVNPTPEATYRAALLKLAEAKRICRLPLSGFREGFDSRQNLGLQTIGKSVKLKLEEVFEKYR